MPLVAGFMPENYRSRVVKNFTSFNRFSFKTYYKYYNTSINGLHLVFKIHCKIVFASE